MQMNSFSAMLVYLESYSVPIPICSGRKPPMLCLSLNWITEYESAEASRVSHSAHLR